MGFVINKNCSPETSTTHVHHRNLTVAPIPLAWDEGEFLTHGASSLKEHKAPGVPAQVCTIGHGTP
eukprot:15436719-Heterocapsa_arctica.AAC.1